jgi:hypothetical protein
MWGGLSGRNRVAFLGAIASLVFLGSAAPAVADSAGATIRSLPESTELQVHAEYHHECSGDACDWFAEASAYSASAGCPSVFDASHIVWSGPVETGGKSSVDFAFSPYGLETEVVVCLYIWANDESSLVGESHHFNRATGREVAPAQELKPAPERHRRRVRYPTSELCKPVKGAGGNVPGIWIMHVHGVHCPTARAVAKTVDRFTNPHHFTVHVAHGRWACSAEEVQGLEDPIGEVTCHRGGAVVVVGTGS